MRGLSGGVVKEGLHCTEYSVAINKCVAAEPEKPTQGTPDFPPTFVILCLCAQRINKGFPSYYVAP